MSMTPELYLETGPFVVALHSSLSTLTDTVRRMYGAQVREDPPEFVDFRVQVRRTPGLSLKRQSEFLLDAHRPFNPLPLPHAYPLLEWGLNWCITAHSHQYLILHAAVVAKDNRALILPGSSGSGKSTLCAALVTRGGWRLLSDELTLIDPETLDIHPLARPVSLKNQSIPLMQRLAPDSLFTDPIDDKRKGVVAHMQAPAASVSQQFVTARARWVLFPRFTADSQLELDRLSRPAAFIDMAAQSFNYQILGDLGFRSMERLLHTVDCWTLRYPGDMEQALECIDRFTLETDSP